MSATQTRKLPRQRIRFSMTLLLIILLSVISFVTSYKGLVILNGATSVESDVWQNAFVAFVVFTIQTTLVVTLLFTIHGYRKVTRFLAFLIYLVAMLFSVFFSYGWWYEIFRAESYAQEVYKSSIEDVRSDAKTYQIAFAHVRETADELSKYSAKKAREENLYGGTCAEASLPGRGALNYLRDDEARIFAKTSEKVTGLEKDVDDNITELNNLLTDEDASPASVQKRELQLNDIVATIGSYRDGPVVTQIKQELVERRGDKREYLESRNPKSLQRTMVSCLDDEVTDRIDDLLAALELLPQTKKITLFDQNNQRTVMERAWKVFSSFFTFERSGTKSIQLTATDYIPVFAGLLIDLFILLLGFIDGLEYGRHYTGKRFSLEDAWDLSRFNDEKVGQTDYLALLQPYLYSGWRHHYLMVPVVQDSLNQREQQLHRVLAWLEASKKTKLFAAGVKFGRLPASMQHYFQADTTMMQARHVHRYDVYRIQKGVWRELVISHARNLPLNNGQDA